MILRRLSSRNALPALIHACGQGQARAQRELFARFYGLAKSICLRYAASREEAEEMIDDGFVRVFAKLSYYDPELPFEPWFRTLVVHAAIDHYRRQPPCLVLTYLEAADEVEHDDQLIEHMSADEILALIQQLTPAYRMVFSLYVVDGYSHPEISRLLGIGESTSRSNLLKARLQLQALLTRHMPEHDTPRRPYAERTL